MAVWINIIITHSNHESGPAIFDEHFVLFRLHIEIALPLNSSVEDNQKEKPCQWIKPRNYDVIASW